MRSRQPVNEYSDNDEYLYGAFWHLFPLHSGLPTTPSGQVGPLSTHVRRHLLTQFHNMFASNHNLIFLLANQTQRAAAARGVVLRVKNGTENFADFEAMVADKENFLEELEAAKKTPTAKASHDLLKKVLRYLTSCGRGIPWSGEERTSELCKMYALWRCFGVPPCFLTAAPDDVHQPSSIRLSIPAGHPHRFPVAVGEFLYDLQKVDHGVEGAAQTFEATYAFPLTEFSSDRHFAKKFPLEQLRDKT